MSSFGLGALRWDTRLYLVGRPILVAYPMGRFHLFCFINCIVPLPNWDCFSNMIFKCRKSSRINTTLAVNGLTPLLIARLDHQDAIARLNLLKLIKVRSILLVLFYYAA